MTIKSSVSLTDDQYTFAKALVAAGQFPSVSAVLQQGVEILRQKREDEILERQALRTLLASRVQQPRLDVASFDQRLSQMLDAKQRAHGLDT